MYDRAAWTADVADEASPLMKTVFNISGPYAVGKDSILNAVLAAYPEATQRVSTWTTRPVDPELDPSYHRVSFDEMADLATSARWIVNYQLGGMTAYATNLDEIEEIREGGRVAVHSILAGASGAGRLREAFGDELVSVALLPTHGDLDHQLEELRRRIMTRNRDASEELAARIKHQIDPLSYVLGNPTTELDADPRPIFDLIEVNEDLAATTGEILSYFESECLNG